MNCFSEDQLGRISHLVREIEKLTDVEKLFLYLQLPCGRADASEVNSKSQRFNGATAGGIQKSLDLFSKKPDQETTQTYTWILSHLEIDQNVSLPKQEVYDEYRAFCQANRFEPLCVADFGKAMKHAFPCIKPRRLGQRGNSRYCYSGLRKKYKIQPPNLPEISGCSNSNNNNNNSSSSSNNDTEHTTTIYRCNVSNCDQPSGSANINIDISSNTDNNNATSLAHQMTTIQQPGTPDDDDYRHNYQDMQLLSGHYLNSTVTSSHQQQQQQQQTQQHQQMVATLMPAAHSSNQPPHHQQQQVHGHQQEIQQVIPMTSASSSNSFGGYHQQQQTSFSGHNQMAAASCVITTTPTTAAVDVAGHHHQHHASPMMQQNDCKYITNMIQSQPPFNTTTTAATTNDLTTNNHLHHNQLHQHPNQYPISSISGTIQPQPQQQPIRQSTAAIQIGPQATAQLVASSNNNNNLHLINHQMSHVTHMDACASPFQSPAPTPYPTMSNNNYPIQDMMQEYCSSGCRLYQST